MPKFKKGEKRPANAGRRKGTANKQTRDIKEAYKMLIEDNLPNLTIWLKRIARKNPEKAIYILSDLSEYVIPKLSRTEAEVTAKIDNLRDSIKPLFPSVDDIINEQIKG